MCDVNFYLFVFYMNVIHVSFQIRNYKIRFESGESTEGILLCVQL